CHCPFLLNTAAPLLTHTLSLHDALPIFLEPLQKAEKLAAPEAAATAWERVLEIRRLYWCPDIPGPFDRALAGLSERVRQAARAEIGRATSELQSPCNLVCRLLLEKKKKI